MCMCVCVWYYDYIISLLKKNRSRNQPTVVMMVRLMCCGCSVCGEGLRQPRSWNIFAIWADAVAAASVAAVGATSNRNFCSGFESLKTHSIAKVWKLCKSMNTSLYECLSEKGVKSSFICSYVNVLVRVYERTRLLIYASTRSENEFLLHFKRGFNGRLLNGNSYG